MLPTFAGSEEAAESERRLAGLAAAVLGGPWKKTLGPRADVLARVRDFHLSHATALLGAQPTTRPTENPVGPINPPSTDKTLDAAVNWLVRAERAMAARHRIPALATTGASALLWGSMSIAATTYATALAGTRPVIVGKPKPPRPLPLLSDVQAVQELVRQLHAINYGYLLAIGRMTAGARRESAIRALSTWRVLRDDLVATLSARRAEVPIADPAYVPTVQPKTNAGAGRLVLDMETRLAPFVALWLTAAPALPERTRAFQTLSTTVTGALTWGAPLNPWPGWP